mmetsp:Transcript_71275/g.214328  ORF Transcript_71275/g.214328 Transcript_71275/m.214328 type:complete len:250 (+) Transcript_71275:333-1082(+)
MTCASSRWLRERAQSGEPLPRRQELPPEAFADMDALREAHAALPPHIASLVLPMLSVSYCWLEARHPDADGLQLRHIVDTLASKGGVRKWFELFPDFGVFWDWGAWPIYQKGPVLWHPCCGGPTFVAPEQRSEAERAVAEAYESSRTPAEREAFKRALEGTMDVWYAHQMIVSVFVTTLPEGYEGRTYDERGWTIFERSSAELIKPAAAYALEEGKKPSERRWLWPMDRPTMLPRGGDRRSHPRCSLRS